MTDSLFIFGFGFSSAEIARQSASSFATVSGTTRSPEKAESITRAGYSGVVWDGTELDGSIRETLERATHLVMSVAPGKKDPVMAQLKGRLRHVCPELRWAGYLSTVGVYGNHDGLWVDEETVPRPTSKRSMERVRAETAWNEAAGDAGIPLAVFRLSGIYGPGRNAIVNVMSGKARRLVKPGQVFNRVHREDIGTAVSMAMNREIGGTFNITDDYPSPPQDVVTFACELAGQEPPPEIDLESADLSPMARSFYGENKRVSNAKSKSLLGMQYAWPDYRTALRKMWEEGSWRASTGL